MATIEYIKGVHEGYEGICGLIDKSEYKLSFFAKQLKMFLPVFYIKKKTDTFTFDEIQKIVAILKQEKDEDAQLVRELDEMKRTQRMLTAEEFKKRLQS
jgi:hypothetical protein